MKPAKQSTKQQTKSVWELVKQEDRDNFFNFLDRKCKTSNKKLREIADLEEQQQQGKDLKPDQLQKIATKAQVTDQVKDYERIANMWYEVMKDSKKQEAQPLEDVFVVLLDILGEQPEVFALLHEEHPSTHELGKHIHKKIHGQQKKQDQQWKGLRHFVEYVPKQEQKQEPEQELVPQSEPVVEEEPQQQQQVHEEYKLVPTQEKEKYQHQEEHQPEQQVEQKVQEPQEKEQPNDDQRPNQNKQHKKGGNYRGNNRGNNRNYDQVKQEDKQNSDSDDGFIQVGQPQRPQQQRNYNNRGGPRGQPRGQRGGRPDQRKRDLEVVYVVKE
ncbi:hypothetical protein pb186bvf_010793 [Paramecium bursaria]